MLGIFLVRAAMWESLKGVGLGSHVNGKALAWGEAELRGINTTWADHLEMTHPKMKG